MTRGELKDIIKECLEEIELESVDLTVTAEDCNVYGDAIIKYALNEGFEADESLEEGANLEMRKSFKKYKKEFKENIKYAKVNIKSGNFDEAKKFVNKAAENIANMEKEIKSIDSSAGSTVLGYFAAGLLSCVEYLPYGILAGLGASVAGSGAASGNVAKSALGALISTGGLIATYAKAIPESIRSFKQLSDDLNSDESVSASDWNAYRNRLLVATSKLKKQVTNLSKCIDQKAKSKE